MAVTLCQYRVTGGVFNIQKSVKKIDYNYFSKDLRLDAYFPLFSCEIVLFSAIFVYGNITLRKKCPYSALFWSAFSRIRTEYASLNAGKCGLE